MSKYLSLACLFIFFFSMASYAANQNDGASAESPSADTSIKPKTGLQEYAGIKTQALQAFSQPVELTAYGSVISLEPLIQLRQQYVMAQAQQNSAQALYQEASQNLQRTQNLHQHDIVSTRRLQEQQAQWQNDKANLSNSSNQQQTILSTSRLQWGDVLTDWFIHHPGKEAEPFFQNHAQLLEIILPANVQFKADMNSVAVNAHGNREQAKQASLLSQAPSVDPVSQGMRYFFILRDATLPIGIHVNAWIPLDDQEKRGVLIPENAVIWHLGQAYVFVKTAQGEFNRHLLPRLTPVDQGNFIADDLKPGDEVVTTGAQTLLSQELKSLIPNEDDD